MDQISRKVVKEVSLYNIGPFNLFQSSGISKPFEVSHKAHASSEDEALKLLQDLGMDLKTPATRFQAHPSSGLTMRQVHSSGDLQSGKFDMSDSEDAMKRNASEGNLELIDNDVNEQLSQSSAPEVPVPVPRRPVPRPRSVVLPIAVSEGTEVKSAESLQKESEGDGAIGRIPPPVPISRPRRPPVSETPQVSLNADGIEVGMPEPSMPPPPVPKTRPRKDISEAVPSDPKPSMPTLPPPILPSRPQRPSVDTSDTTLSSEGSSAISTQEMLDNPAFTTMSENLPDVQPNPTNSNNSSSTSDSVDDDRPRIPTAPARRAPPVPASRPNAVGPDVSLMNLDEDPQMPMVAPPPVPPTRPCRPTASEVPQGVTGNPFDASLEGPAAAPPPLPARPNIIPH